MGFGKPLGCLLQSLNGRRRTVPLDYQELTAVSLIILGPLLGASAYLSVPVHLRNPLWLALLLTAAQIGGLTSRRGVGGMLLGFPLRLDQRQPQRTVGVSAACLACSPAWEPAPAQETGRKLCLVTANLLLPLSLGIRMCCSRCGGLCQVPLLIFSYCPQVGCLRRLARALPSTEEQRRNQELSPTRGCEKCSINDWMIFARAFEELSATFNQIPAAHQCLTAAVTITLSLPERPAATKPALQTCPGRPAFIPNLLGYGGAIGRRRKEIPHRVRRDLLNRWSGCMQPYQYNQHQCGYRDAAVGSLLAVGLLKESHELVINQLEGLSQIMRSFDNQMELEVEFDEEWR